MGGPICAALECRDCGAALLVAAQLRTARCRYCASYSVVERPPTPDRPEPVFAMGFILPADAARAIARGWLRRPWFAPSSFRRAEVDQLVGVYVPAYIYSAAAHSDYAVEIGEHYTRRDSNGKRRTSTEWRTLQGRYACYVEDRLVTASRGVANQELEAIEPFDLRALASYEPATISGWLAEEPSLGQARCLELARKEALALVGQRLAAFMPGDAHRLLRHRTQLSREDLALTLLPVWVLPVRYADDKPPVRLLVNGQTGKIHGRAPVAWWKVALVVLVPLGLLGLAVALVLGAAMILEAVS